jgi:NADPH-dependent 2,4-dienoyl-CoA reductase/sulfur reductase-like enzyme
MYPSLPRAFRRFGADVTVVEMGPRLIGREDEDVSAAVQEIMEAEGIIVRTGAECISLAPHTKGVSVSVKCTEGDPEIIGSDVLLAVGRRPNTDDLGLDKAGVAVDARGYITVDDFLVTNVAGIWRSAIATAAARLRIPPTMISKSSPPTCSTASSGGSAIGRSVMHSISIRRWAASV